MPDNLAIPADEIREMGRAALDLIASYYDTLADRDILHPTTSADLRALLDEPAPTGATPFPELLGTFRGVVEEYSRHNAHARFFGYVSSPGNPVNTVGSMIAAALNINVTCWRSGPAAAEMELLTIRWLKELLGFPHTGAGLLVSGGSMANFAGIAAARSAKAPHDVMREGMHGAAGRMRLYASSEAHFSIRKAASLLGIGAANVRVVRTDPSLRMDLQHLDDLVREDRAAGHLPFCVVASAGTAGTGAIDPIGPIADFARAHDLWLHVDGAYGGFAALAGSAREALSRIGDADSLSLDPHKWLYLPVGCGCVLYRDPAAARAAFSENAEYTRVIGLQDDESFAFWDYGPELSRPFRALDLWLLMKSVGTTALAAAIEENIACARYFAELVNASDDFEMLAPVDLSIFCFRYRPKNFAGDLDKLNENLMIALQRGGSSYVSNAKIDGKFALRGCVLNYRTTRRDMERLLEDLRALVILM
uniref:Pyridoxal-dependent decarboxylase n=1 Tax=Solibacter usitatus (strain Ellin6076) TaxID=234267 RepID=Q01ND5_SOLUE